MTVFALRKIKLAISSSPKSRKQLVHLTKIPERTLRYKLAILKKEGLVKEIPVFTDLRKKLFTLRGESE